MARLGRLAGQLDHPSRTTEEAAFPRPGDPASPSSMFTPAERPREHVREALSGDFGRAAEITRQRGQRRVRAARTWGSLVEQLDDRVFLPADMVDAIVYRSGRRTDQGIARRSLWPAARPTECVGPIDAALAQVRAVNRLVGLARHRAGAGPGRRRAARRVDPRRADPARGPRQHRNRPAPGAAVPDALRGRPSAEQVTLMVGERTQVDRWCRRRASTSGHRRHETGSCPPPRYSSSAPNSLKRRVLGVLQTNGAGNVDVDRRSDSVRDYVGPGGFIDLTTDDHAIVFVSDWIERGEVRHRGRTAFASCTRAPPKFVDARATRSPSIGPRALAAGKEVFCAGPRRPLPPHRARHGARETFMPGIDVRRDVLEAERRCASFYRRTDRIPDPYFRVRYVLGERASRSGSA